MWSDGEHAETGTGGQDEHGQEALPNNNRQRGWTGVGTVVKQVGSGSHGDGSCCCVVVWIAAHASWVAVVGWSVSLYSALMTFFGARQPGHRMVSRTNGSRLMRRRGYLSNFFFSSRFGNEAWKRPLAADLSPALEENGVTIAVSMSAL